jgi:hypothetical protein
MIRAQEQEHSPDGIRHTRHVIVRNTYRELTDTTIKTFHSWIPRDAGEWLGKDMTFTINGGDFHTEFMFRALDKPGDVKKLLSMEFTVGWVNEAREIPKSIIDMMGGRAGRYPDKSFGGPTWYGIIMDTNPPDTDSWWYRIFEQPDEYGNYADGWRLFRQPSARGPDAENIENLPHGYYDRQLFGKTEEWISIYVDGNYGYTMEGKPIHPKFNHSVHVLAGDHEVLPKRPLLVGADFGLTPAAVILQYHPLGYWVVLDEIVTEDMGADEFGPAVIEHLHRHYPGMEYCGWGDPSGDTRSQANSRMTVFTELYKTGLMLSPCQTNDLLARISTVNRLLGTLAADGKPRLRFSKKAQILIKAMAGGYHYRRVNIAGLEKFEDRPNKNSFSHVAEALQYALVGDAGYTEQKEERTMRRRYDERPAGRHRSWKTA